MAVWEKNFCLPDPITKEKMSALEKNFVSMARQNVKFGPNSVSNFTKWRVGLSFGLFQDVAEFFSPLNLCDLCALGSQVELLAKQYLSSLTEPKEEIKETKENGVRIKLWT